MSDSASTDSHVVQDEDDYEGEVQVTPEALFPSSWSTARRSVVLAVALAVASGVAFGGYLGIQALVGSDSSRTITGTLALSDPDSPVAQGVSACYGTGGYSDIRTGAAVTVSDAQGKILALGALQSGTPGTYGICEFSFSIPNVPKSSFYQVQVSHRGQLPFSAADLEKNGWKVEASLGR